uniref:Tify domain-containing protein n=1 Tax=Ananas comosus var. bracteatus TaxID=296719 RepID=A0A6V7QG08_ANACO|nr:unnamed protein product [Ananas comosus var. bracteatus]
MQEPRRITQNNHICLEMERAYMKWLKYLEKVPPALLYVEVLNVTGLREKMKFRNSDELLKVQATHVSVEKPSKYQALRSVGDLPVEGRKEREMEPRSEEFLFSSKGLKVSAKYNPRSLLSDVRGLLSTGLLEGFRVTYKKARSRLRGLYEISDMFVGCRVCNYKRVLCAVEFEKHAGVTTTNQNNHIFLNSGNNSLQPSERIEE